MCYATQCLKLEAEASECGAFTSRSSAYNSQVMNTSQNFNRMFLFWVQVVEFLR